MSSWLLVGTRSWLAIDRKLHHLGLFTAQDNSFLLPSERCRGWKERKETKKLMNPRWKPQSFLKIPEVMAFLCYIHHPSHFTRGAGLWDQKVKFLGTRRLATSLRIVGEKDRKSLDLWEDRWVTVPTPKPFVRFLLYQIIECLYCWSHCALEHLLLKTSGLMQGLSILLVRCRNDLEKKR